MKKIYTQIFAGCTVAMMLTVLMAHRTSAQNSGDKPDSLPGISGQLLEEVVVTAKAPAVRVTPDKIVYDLKSSIVGQTGTLLDALSSIPGISVSNSGSVGLYGNRGVAILVDGQKIHLKGQQFADYLRSLPATTVSTVGLRTVVNAKDDASDKAGVIEITTRRIRDRGFTLGFHAGASAWNNARCNGSIDMAYTTPRSEVTLLCSSFAAKQKVSLDIDRFFITDTDRMLQKSTRRRTDNGNTLRAGWRYRMTPRTDFAANLSYSYNGRNEFGRMEATIPALNASNRSDNHTRNRRHNIMADVYLEHHFNSGATLSGGLNHFRFGNRERQVLEPVSPDTLYSTVRGHIQWYIDRMDLTLPFGNTWKLQAGIKNTFVTIHDTGKYSERKTGEWIPDSTLSSTFSYKANTNAAYAQIAFTRGNITATMGARLETESVRGNFSGNKTASDSSYRVVTLDIVPAMQLKYLTSNGAAFMLAYSRRVDRPNYADLNPFTYIFDEYTQTGGNINLHSSTADNFQFGFSYGSRWQGVVFLTYSDYAIMKSYRELTDGSVYVASENLPYYMQCGIRLVLANQPIGSRCRTTLTATCMHNRYDWMDGLTKTINRRFTPIVNIDNQFDFGAGWTGELNCSYTGKMAYGQVTVKPTGYVDSAIRKSFRGGRASLTLFVKDIFASAVTRTEFTHGGRNASYDETEYKRMAGLSFHYKFNTGRKTSGKRDPKAPEELDRL